jgi:serine/threonine protein kinase
MTRLFSSPSPSCLPLSQVLNNLGQDGHSREQQQEVINMAEREATFASQFRHRHVVSLLHVIIDSPDRERVILVYDLVEGVELFDLVNSQPDCHLPEGRCRRYFRQLGMAVEYIHERGVAHRDIKPVRIFAPIEMCLAV